MARSNTQASRVKPEHAAPLTLEVLRSTRLSPGFVRVTLGGGDVARFTPMGFDQWFRLFIPVSDDSLAHVPEKLSLGSYLRFVTTAKGSRPVLRNYTVRAFRPAAGELDVDFVVHGDGPAGTWAATCAPGDQVAIIDEGITFTPPAGTTRFALVADESGLPAVAGVLASLDPAATGVALVEVPHEEDKQEVQAPPGVAVTWVVREDPHAVAGRAVLAAATALELPRPFFGFVVGEAGLATGLRRHWVKSGVPKEDVLFCGYWKAG
ncbi:siderophore-interacting protein [Actinokineospora bangkokensis]|uniref:NADPH-dependent ferric siderophore reductase n=1 Tax=Actinokineospora bangkokensis TaxID=1193682 RepID=A0A1Q9LR69_9PSEU|nr:siderophore-interacting protein [Actinokineospora bangkokensis]OLR94512.1 NADPH-dependent ferric siderophore reductase [Actinokineospora bangkokensis]